MHVMLDLETLGSTPGSVILSIGAVAFNSADILATYEMHIDARSCQRAGLTIDADTVMWWLGRDDQARTSILGGSVASLNGALLNFSEWMRGRGQPIRLWSKGPSFDAAILRAAYLAADIDIPWDFRQERCVRTVLDLAAIDSTIGFREPADTRHDALADALAQTRAVQACLKRLLPAD